MRFSVAVASQHKVSDEAAPQGARREFDLESVVTECQVAESAGFYAAYTGERRASGPTSYSHNPLLMASFMLSHTSTLRVGAGIVVLPLHHPVTVAQDASLLSSLYEGRFRLALGAGYTDADFEALGVPLTERGRRMEVGLRAIDAYRRLEPYELEPPYRGLVPLRDEALGPDRLDVMAGGWSIPGVRRAAQFTDGWITGPLDTVPALVEMADRYREECDSAGKTPHLVVLREAWLADTDAEARRVYGSHVLDYHRIYLQRGRVYDPRFDPWVKDVASADDLTLDHVLPDRVLCGSTDTWIETLDEWVEILKPDELILRLRHVDGPPSPLVVETMERIGSEIIPRYRDSRHAAHPVPDSAPAEVTGR
jgi:alkanesulfonate monooxygenase SsuD/methylene tetrahydromethanopterin reductase-like flavin-dependent oxidoreductase (luciferase family)